MKKEKPIIMDAELEHLPYLIENMREMDREECHAMTGADPGWVLEQSLKMSPAVWSFMQNGRCLGMAGVASESLISEKGIPWMLLTDEILNDWPLAYARHSREFVVEMLSHYSYLENYVDTRNTISIKWLKWLGFDVRDVPEPFGPYNKLFHKFTLRKEDFKCAS